MNPVVQQIVDRCHVGRSNRSVIGYVASRIKGGRRGFLALPRAWLAAVGHPFKRYA